MIGEGEYQGGRTICKVGGKVTCLAMILRTYNLSVRGEVATPKSLNEWLMQNGGLGNGGEIEWSKLSELGVKVVSINTRDVELMRRELKKGSLLIGGVMGGRVQVMVWKMEGNMMKVRDPAMNQQEYYTSALSYAIIIRKAPQM
jgi:hypothetical protein